MVVKVTKGKNPDTEYNKGSGLPGFFGELGNFGTDTFRETGNFFGSAIPDWLTGSTTAPGEGLGDAAWGARPGTNKPVGKTADFLRTPNLPQEEAPAPLTFADYLAMANEMGLGGSSGPDYSALKAQLKTNGAQGDAKLQAMYSQLQSSIDADSAGIGQSYDQAGQRIAQSGDQARQQTNAGFAAARAAQQQQFAALGIQDAGGVLAANGNAAGNDQAVANANVLQNQNANQQQNTQSRSSALNYNTNIGNAAGLEGAVQRAALQQQLATKLAELEGAQTESQGSAARNSFQAALQLAQNPALFDPNYQGDPKDSLEAQLLAGQVTAQDLKNQALAANSSGTVGGNLTQYQTLAQAYGVDPSNQEDFLNFIKLVNETK